MSVPNSQAGKTPAVWHVATTIDDDMLGPLPYQNDIKLVTTEIVPYQPYTPPC
jgi:hypothetical protein